MKRTIEVEIPDGKYCNGCPFNNDNEERRHCSYFDEYSYEYSSEKYNKCKEQFKEND